MAEEALGWQDARHHLDDATESHTESLATFGSSIHANLNDVKTSSLETSLPETQVDSSLTNPGWQQLEREGKVQNEIRNMSSVLVPANRLPYEVLLETFHLCAVEDSSPYHDPSCSDWHYSLAELFRLTHVCAAWRRIMLAEPSFWSRIDIDGALVTSDFTKTLHCIQMSIERARNRPVCLGFDLSTLQSHDISPIISYEPLWPSLNQLRSLTFRDWKRSSDLINLLTRCFQSTQGGSIQGLMLWQDYLMDPCVIHPFIGADEHNLLRPLRVLSLHGMRFNWGSPAYHNLVHLHLAGLPYLESPRIDELAAILHSSPELHTLELIDLFILPSDHQIQPVNLKHLRTLDLQSTSDVDLLLPLIVVSASHAFSMRIGLHSPSSPDVAAIRLFLARINLTRLYIDCTGDERTVPEYLAVAPNLNTLILDFNGEEVGRYMSAITGATPPLCPRLRSLYFCNAWLQDWPLPDFMLAYPFINKLRFIECVLTFSSTNEEVVRQLTALVPDTAEDCLRTPRDHVEVCWHYFMT